jgi:2-polyprenyl-6-methoxyphenol hydroxylase-like FAD-dependent oxidoreductase
VAAGVVAESINLWVKGKRVARVAFGNIGEGMTPFPFILDFAQDEHERFLIGRLRAEGVEVERDRELVGLEPGADGIRARLRKGDGTIEECSARYVVGCDGAHSAVRHAMGIEFGGGTYQRLFYVADAQARGPAIDDGLHVGLDEADLLALFDMKGEGRMRLVGTIVPSAAAGDASTLTFDDVAHRPLEQLHVTVDQVNWFSTYRVHHRVASRFSEGRVFLAGDAAHVHSPVGAQGMNTGIGDAVNLSWKLAAVLRGKSPETLLDSYRVEREAFARRLVATTDRAFEIASSPGRMAAMIRTRIFPTFVRAVFASRRARRFLFRTVSQLVISYHDSPVSEGKAGSLRAGDRLPWVPVIPGIGHDNHAPLSSLEWQVHMYATGSESIGGACVDLGIALHIFPWTPPMERAGLAPGAVYLIRPDGYIALADSDADPNRLLAYASRWLRG